MVFSVSGEILAKYRELNSQSYRQQASLMGISVSYLHDICFGKRDLSFTVFKKIIDSYPLDSSEFLELANEVIGTSTVERFLKVVGSKSSLSNGDKINLVSKLFYIISGEELDLGGSL